MFITHPLTFARSYWLLYVTRWDSPRAITPVCFDVCLAIISVEKGKSHCKTGQEKSFNFSSLLHCILHIKKKTISFCSQVILPLKSWSQILSQRVHNSQQLICIVEVFERRGKGEGGVTSRLPDLVLCKLSHLMKYRINAHTVFKANCKIHQAFSLKLSSNHSRNKAN